MIQDAVEILLFVICILLSAFFSSSEVALISITRAKARTLVNEGLPGSNAVAALKEKPDRLLITILIGNNIVNIAAASLATAIAISIFGDVGVGIATGFVVICSAGLRRDWSQDLCDPGIGFICTYVAPVIFFLSRILYPGYLAGRTGEPEVWHR